MEHEVFAIYDLKLIAYSFFFPAVNRGGAVRAITDMMDDPRNQLSRHSSDFELHSLCRWDDKTGEFNRTDRQNLGNLSQWRKERDGNSEKSS